MSDYLIQSTNAEGHNHRLIKASKDELNKRLVAEIEAMKQKMAIMDNKLIQLSEPYRRVGKYVYWPPETFACEIDTWTPLLFPTLGGGQIEFMTARDIESGSPYYTDFHVSTSGFYRIYAHLLFNFYGVAFPEPPRADIYLGILKNGEIYQTLDYTGSNDFTDISGDMKYLQHKHQLLRGEVYMNLVKGDVVNIALHSSYAFAAYNLIGQGYCNIFMETCHEYPDRDDLSDYTPNIP